MTSLRPLASCHRSSRLRDAGVPAWAVAASVGRPRESLDQAGKEPHQGMAPQGGPGRRVDGYELERLGRCEWKRVATPIFLRFADDCFAQVRLSVPIKRDQVHRRNRSLRGKKEQTVDEARRSACPRMSGRPSLCKAGIPQQTVFQAIPSDDRSRHVRGASACV